MQPAPTKEFLLQALENDMLAHHRPFANLPTSTTFPDKDCFFYISQINFGAFGGILAQRLTEANADRRIKELNQAIKDSGKDVGWVISPLATPTDLEQRLANSGARKLVELKGMVLNMSDLATPPLLPNLVIKKVDDEASLVDYARIYPLLFHVPVDDWIEDLVAAELHIFRNNGATWNRWVAYEDGKPIAAARTAQVDGFASLQILCTLPECRNRGIGQVLATHGLKHEGNGHAIVWSGPGADRLYSRMGYKEICTASVYDFIEAV